MDVPHRALGSILSDLVSDEAERVLYRADPEAFLAERGFPDFPDRLVGEAVCQVADTLPASVAEQLAPEVMALSPLTTGELAQDLGAGGHDALAALAAVPPSELVDLELGIGEDVSVDTDAGNEFVAEVVGVDPELDAEDGSDTESIDRVDPGVDSPDPAGGAAGAASDGAGGEGPTVAGVGPSGASDGSDLGFGTGVEATEDAVLSDLVDDSIDAFDLEPGDDLEDVTSVADHETPELDELPTPDDTSDGPEAPEPSVDEPADSDLEWEPGLE